MALQVSPVIFIYLVSTLLNGIITYFTWRTRSTRVVTLWALTMTFIFIWSVFNLLEMMVADLFWKFIFIRMQYIGITGLIYCWGIFSIYYATMEKWLNKYSLYLLAVVPLITIGFVLFANQNTLFYESYELVNHFNLILLDLKHGIIFYIWTAYAYVILLVSTILMIYNARNTSRLFQGQAIFVILSASIPTLANLLFVLNVNPITPLDPSPLLLTISGVLMLIGIQGFQFWEIVPVAYSLIYENVRSGIIILDRNGRIMRINPSAEVILLRRRNDVVGKHITDEFPEHPILIGHITTHTELKTEIHMGNPSRVYEFQITPLTNHNNKIIGRILMFYDITERDGLINELNAYAHTVAHDLKNPLSIVMGYADLLDYDLADSLSPTHKIHLEQIVQSSQKMQFIIDELLLLASIRSMDEVPVEPLDMLTIIKDAQSRFIGQIHHATFDLPETLPVAVGYAPWVEAIWANYISNALKYGGNPPHIQIGANVEGKQICFWIRDNGPGLTESEKNRLFSLFKRIEDHLEIEGHGLGLSIVDRITNRLGGHVGVESELNNGSKFYFTLPRYLQ